MDDQLQDQGADEFGTISAALSPVQLAAIMGSASLSQSETLSNRIWGGVGLVGGVFELLGSAALLVDPDPTVSKAIGAVGLVHGGDVTLTSWNQLRTGEAQQTLTAQAAEAIAQTAGMSPAAAGITGAVVDILVPTGVLSELGRTNALARLTRVQRIRTGFISLEEEERTFNFPNKPSASAHTIREHVGKTLQEMQARFTTKPSLQATGSFRDLQTAENAVSQVLRSNAAQIKVWASGAGAKPLRLSLKLGQEIGMGVVNPAKAALPSGAAQAVRSVRTVTILLNKTTLNGRTWYVLTAFPDIMRDLGLTAM